MNATELLKKVKWLGHDTFRFETGGNVILTDPFQLRRDERADLVLITHGHYDHCSPEDLRRVFGSGTLVVADRTAAEVLGPREGLTVMSAGGRAKVCGIEIEAVPAYNVNKKFHPKGAGMVGYIFTIEGVRIYLAGDTDIIPEMKGIDAGIAFLPVGGAYTMTASEAAEAARLINPKVAVPMHYGSIVGSAEDARQFAKLLAGKAPVHVFERV